MPLNIIVALAEDNAIGHDGTLIWHLKPDLRHFKSLTVGHAIIMGRRTWESLPAGPLPNRHNIVVSRNKDYQAPGAILCQDMEQAINHALSLDAEPFIIGGAKLYEATLPFVARLYLTRVGGTYPQADTRFPAIDMTQWREGESSPLYTDEATGLTYRFMTLERKNACSNNQ